MRILIVDDSKVARMLVRSLIEEYDDDISLLEASNGQEGLTLFKRENPDITLLDLTMPVMDGYEALKCMKSFRKNSIVVILTADIQEKAVERCLSLGAEGVLKKLPEKGELFRELDELRKKFGL